MLKITAGMEGEEPFFEARFDAKEIVNDPEDYLDKTDGTVAKRTTASGSPGLQLCG
jgi:hypothetical protein